MERFKRACPECGVMVEYPPKRKRKTMEEIKAAWEAKHGTRNRP